MKGHDTESLFQSETLGKV